MRIELNPVEARVIACLVEKEIVTPAQYPLSLNALTLACNQKTSRDPVMNLSDAEVQDVLDGLVKKHLVSDRGGFGSRVTKYKHRFANVGFGSLEFSAQELGILCVLLLRGPQTPGELRTNTNRLCKFADMDEVELALLELSNRHDGPFVKMLPREAGKRESRYMHLFGNGEADDAMPEASAEASHAVDVSPEPGSDRIGQLEELVLELQQRLDDMQVRLERLEH